RSASPSSAAADAHAWQIPQRTGVGRALTSAAPSRARRWPSMAPRMNTALRCIGAVSAWLALAPAAHAALPGANGMIAFDCGGICTVKAHRSGLRKVGVGTKPAWSPDGNRIVFERVTAESDPFSDLYAMDADGSNVRQITATSGPDFTPAFSADGSRVVYGTTDTPGVYMSLFSVRADGSD